MSKKKTALQLFIERLEESIKDIDPAMRTHNTVSAIIEVANEYLPAERQQIDIAFQEGYNEHARKEEKYLDTDYFTSKYESNG